MSGLALKVTGSLLFATCMIYGFALGTCFLIPVDTVSYPIKQIGVNKQIRYIC